MITHAAYFVMANFEVYTVDTFLSPLMVFMLWHQVKYLVSLSDAPRKDNNIPKEVPHAAP